VTVEETPDGVRTLDNGLVRVTIAADGTVAAIDDLLAGRRVLAAGASANVLHLHPDHPVRFDAWDIDEFHRRSVTELRQTSSIALDDSDPGRPRVVVTRVAGASRYVQSIALAVGQRRVEFTLDVDWHESERLLTVTFPLAVHADRSTSETQFGHVHRATHTNTGWDAARFEFCAQRWLHVAEPGFGVAVVNDSTYGHAVTRPGPGDAQGAGATTVRLSLLRAPRYPDPNTDQGRHTLRFSLVSGATIEDAVREGYDLNLPQRSRRGAGAVEPLVVATGAALVEAVKLADDRSGDVVVRLYEYRGGRGRVSVRPTFPTVGADVCDLLERPDEAVAALAPATRAADGTVSFEVGPFQIVTLRFRR
jgi:alpha-mannosidase